MISQNLTPQNQNHYISSFIHHLTCPEGPKSHDEGSLTVIRLSALPIPKSDRCNEIILHKDDKMKFAEQSIAEWYIAHPNERNVTHLIIRADGYKYDYKMSQALQDAAENAAREGRPVGQPKNVEWYVNFADKALFGNYAKPFTFNTDEVRWLF